MSWLWLILLGLIFLLFIGGLFLSRGGNYNTNLNPFGESKLNSCVGTETRLEFPLNFDTYNGVYRTKINIGDQTGDYVTFSVIPDLGSSILIVGGPQCVDCNRSDGVWNNTLGKNISDGKESIIRYGSQTSTYLPWRAYLRNYNVAKEINFGVITNSDSNDGRPLNVMGLTHKENGFLEGVCGEKTITFDFKNNKMYLGKADDIINRNNNNGGNNNNGRNGNIVMDLIESAGGPEFVMSNIQDIYINDIKIDQSLVPQYAIWDTGATDSFLPDDLYDFVYRNSNNLNNTKLTMTFKNGTSITRPVNFNIGHNNISKGRLPIPNALLVGNQWMNQHNFSIQHDQAKVIIF